MWKLILKFIGGFLSVVAAATIVWRVAVYFDDQKDESEVIKTQLDTIIDTQDHQTKMNDSIYVKLEKLSKDVNVLKEEEQALRKSYVRYLSNDEALTKEDFINYMQGLTLDLKKKEIVSDLIVSEEVITPPLKLEK